jgi:chemotaxis protein methyltransferase CheR
VTPQDYEFLRKFLKDKSGLVLSNEKQYLIESRLMPVARKNNLAGITELVARIKTPGNDALAVAITEAMTTNESFFFRDKTPFDLFKDVIMPAMIKERATKKSIRIWCAAASTGQEPYSLAMLLKEMAPQLAGWRIEIIGTDLSQEVLDRAKAGSYSQFEVQRGLPIQLLLKYFTQNGDTWTVSPEIRSMVQYRYLNLLNDFSSLGTFDIVYCRNVLIYFDQPTKTDVLNRVAKLMAPDAFMLLGAAETVVGLTEAFKPMPERRGLYVHAAAAPAAPSRFTPLQTLAARSVPPLAPTQSASPLAPRPVSLLGTTR